MVGEACLRLNLKFHTRLITPFPVGFEYSNLSFAYRFTRSINGLGKLPTYFSLMPKDQKNIICTMMKYGAKARHLVQAAVKRVLKMKSFGSKELFHVMSMRDCDKTQMSVHGKHGTH